jgi:hypothetical protein
MMVSAPLGVASASAASAGATSPAAHPTWLITDSAIQLLINAGLPRSLLLQDFNTPSTILISPQGEADPAIPNASLAESFTSYTDLAKAFASGAVPSRVKTVLLDLEHWSFTPADEQANPFTFADRARKLAHQHGCQLIFAPAVNLMPVISGNNPPPGTTKSNQYINFNVAGKGSLVTDYFEIQSQATEATPDAARFAPKTASQAHAASSAVQVLVGLSTNPNGRVVTAADMAQLYNETHSSATGYWINIPSGGKYCPSCGTPQPKVAVKFLQSLPAS